MWKECATLQSEAEFLCAIFKKKDYENKRGSHSFKDVLIILLACVSKTTIHLLWRQKETQKSDLKFLELPQTLLFISQYCDSFVILFAAWNGTPRDKKTLLWNPSPALGFWHYTSRECEGHQNEPFFPFESQSDQHQFTPNSINTQSKEKVMRIFEMITWGRSLIFSQILSTNSLSKCIEISLENSNRNSGTQILLKSPIPWDWHLSLNTYNTINNNNII